MKSTMSFVGALAASLIAGSALAQATTVNLTSTSPYSSLVNYTNCTTGPTYDCQPYTVGMGVSGSFSLAGPLAANLNNVEIGGQVTAYSFNSGLATISSTSPNSRLHTLKVTTNGAGVVTAINLLQLIEWRGAGSASNRMHVIAVTGNKGSSTYNDRCTAQGSGNSGVTDSCTSAASTETSRSTARDSEVALTQVSVAAAVPTLSEWAMILFGTALAGAAVRVMQRRRFTLQA